MKRVLIAMMVVVFAFALLAGCDQAPASDGGANDESKEETQGDDQGQEATQGNEQGQEASDNTQEPAEQTFNLKLAGIKTDDDPASLAMALFAEEVNKNSGGTITVKTYTNSSLGNLNDLLSGMTDGTVEMMYNTFSCYSWIDGAKRFAVMSAPFLWDDNQQMQAFIESDIAAQWLDEAAKASGVRTLIAKGELPPRQLTCNQAVTYADDFKGLKVRTAEAPIVQETMKRLGAVPTVVPFSDLYMALKQGVVDAQENNFITVMTSSLYEVQSHFMKTDYIRDVSAIYVSEDIWQQMSDRQKQVMRDAAEKAVALEEELVAEKLQEAMDFLNGKMTFVEIDVPSIQAKLGSELYEEFDAAGEIWPTGTIEEILKFKENYEG